MRRTVWFGFLLGWLAAFGAVSCSIDRAEHREVARSFVEQLNRCLDEPSDANREKLADFCSAYTLSLSQNPSWAMRVVPAGTFRYAFVSDSLSHDKMKAFVWFSNAAQGPDAPVYCVELRQSLGGWVVDMPLF